MKTYRFSIYVPGTSGCVIREIDAASAEDAIAAAHYLWPTAQSIRQLTSVPHAVIPQPNPFIQSGLSLV